MEPAEIDLPWKVLVVDDDASIHQVTTLALMDFEYSRRPVELIHASSSAEARELLQANPDTALIFLDVVMESESAGLEFVDYVRNDLQNQLVRIILRTGQAARLSMREVLERYDINDFCEKTELTDARMFLVTYSAFRDYELLQHHASISEQLAETVENLASSNEKLAAFVNIAAHDIRAPLRKLKWRADRATKALAGGDPHAASEELQAVCSATERLQTMLTLLLEYASLGHKAPELSPVSLDDVLRAVVSNLEMQLRASRGSIAVPPKLPRVMGEPLLLAILFQNLCGNALKFTREGMIPIISIDVEPGDADGTVWIHVKDNGIGIEPELIDKVFEPFTRGAAAVDHDGAGLGLAIVEQVVKELQGEIRLHSELGKSTTVSIRLPLADS